MIGQDPSVQNSGVKQKSKKKWIIIGIITAVIGFCCIFSLVFSTIKNATPSGKATLTQSALENETTSQEEASNASLNQTEEAEPTIKNTETEVPTYTSTVKPSSTPQPTPTKNPYLYAPGTYIVGSDIEPGIYYGEAGEDLWGSCYWERLSDLSGDFDSIITNNNAVGQFYVEIKETDFAFDIDCAIINIKGVPEPEQFFTDLSVGTYIIGRDIQPGLYKGKAGEDIGDSCYWERLSNVSGSFYAIIANDNATGQFYIQVSQSDFALYVGCPVSYQGD